MKLLHVLGARPNFMKAAPVIFALQRRPEVSQFIVHTGQHYDEEMSEIFFRQLGLPQPDVNLHVGSGSHAAQTAQIMLRIEPVLLSQRPDWLVVYGDVNSTVACALVAAKLGIPVAHVEAGLRSNDRTMPEELNRIITDQLSDLLFTPSGDANENLKREGIAPKKVHLIGNCMIDSLARLLPKARRPTTAELGERFILATLHRPSNVDSAAQLPDIIKTLNELSNCCQVVFPVHPRTQQRIGEFGLTLVRSPRLLLLGPQGYLEFLWLLQHAQLVLTDSGGVQEETTALQVPCLTMRDNTERPITCWLGTNRLVGHDMGLLRIEAARVLGGKRPSGQIPPLWDGRAGERVADVFYRLNQPS